MLVIDMNCPTSCANCDIAVDGHACDLALKGKTVGVCPIKGVVADNMLFEVKNGRIFTARIRVGEHDEMDIHTGERKHVMEHIAGGDQIQTPVVDVRTIVRCRACRYYDNGTCLSPNTNYTEPRLPNWFCGDGKRMEK